MVSVTPGLVRSAFPTSRLVGVLVITPEPVILALAVLNTAPSEDIVATPDSDPAIPTTVCISLDNEPEASILDFTDLTTVAAEAIVPEPETLNSPGIITEEVASIVPDEERLELPLRITDS